MSWRSACSGVAAALAGAAICTATAGGAAKLAVPAGLFLANTRGSATETQLVVQPAGAGVGLDKPPPFSVTVYVPAGYQLDLSLPPGTPVGGVSAGGSLGILKAGDPAADTTDLCGPGLHAALWTADLSLAGTPLPIRVFVDPTTGDETNLGAYRLTYCITYVPRLILDVLTSPSATGLYTWRAFVTPPGADAGTFSPARTYELRAIVPVPHVIKASARYLARWQTLVIFGKVIAGGQPEAGARISIVEQRGTRPLLGNTRTRADGTFAIKKVVRRTESRRVLSLEATADAYGPCNGPSTAPAGCSVQTSPKTTTSFTATIPKR